MVKSYILRIALCCQSMLSFKCITMELKNYLFGKLAIMRAEDIQEYSLLILVKGCADHEYSLPWCVKYSCIQRLIGYAFSIQHSAKKLED